jgi:hypothetical protein
MADEAYQLARPDPDRMQPFEPCVDNYGVGDPDDPWANNCLANDAVSYSNGLIARAEVPVDLRYDPAELSLCARLAAEAARMMGPWWPAMYSANTPHTAAFFASSATFGQRPAPDPECIRAVFSEALIPEAKIVVEELAERGEWWASVLSCVADSSDDDPEFDSEAELTRWRSVIRWFARQPELHGCSIARIRVPRHRGVRGGCVFPWLAVGMTDHGSLAGISTCLVKS